jgi:hypothetical protein
MAIIIQNTPRHSIYIYSFGKNKIIIIENVSNEQNIENLNVQFEITMS